MRAYLASDLPEVNGWLLAHGKAPLPEKRIPETGCIEPGVAVGFLYTTDSDVSFIEGYVTNPAAGMRARSEAIDAITQALLTQAHELGAGLVVAICTAESTARRALGFGLTFQGAAAVMAREVV